MDWRHLLEIVSAIRALGCLLLNLCVWVKPNGGMGSLYRSRHELVFVFGKPDTTRLNDVEVDKHRRNRTNVWNYPGLNSSARRGRARGHDLPPTVKPIAMVSDAILDVTQRDDIVLDAFCGAGTTLLAAERTGRCGYAMELDPGHVDTAMERWQRMTKQTAVHANGKTFEEMRAERRREDLGTASRHGTRAHRNRRTKRDARRGKGSAAASTPRQESTLEIMDRLLARRVSVSVNGQKRSRSRTQGDPCLQLTQKAISRNGRARRALVEI